MLGEFGDFEDFFGGRDAEVVERGEESVDSAEEPLRGQDAMADVAREGRNEAILYRVDIFDLRSMSEKDVGCKKKFKYCCSFEDNIAVAGKEVVGSRSYTLMRG